MKTPELDEHVRATESEWRRFGPYLSERQWGTVREDYSEDDDAWGYLPHDHARSRAYRWGEDGIGGFSDDQLRLCLSVALWNTRDAILKERLFGVAGPEGNHGEDVKEVRRAPRSASAQDRTTRGGSDGRGVVARDVKAKLIAAGVDFTEGIQARGTASALAASASGLRSATTPVAPCCSHIRNPPVNAHALSPRWVSGGSFFNLLALPPPSTM